MVLLRMVLVLLEVMLLVVLIGWCCFKKCCYSSEGNVVCNIAADRGGGTNADLGAVREGMLVDSMLLVC